MNNDYLVLWTSIIFELQLSCSLLFVYILSTGVFLPTKNKWRQVSERSLGEGFGWPFVGKKCSCGFASVKKEKQKKKMMIREIEI